MSDLDNAATYARRMATNPDTPDNERALWQQIADEIDTYLNQASDHHQGALL